MRFISSSWDPRVDQQLKQASSPQFVDLTLTGANVKTLSNTDLTLLPHGTGIVEVGDAGSTDHSLAANDDLFISGKFEVDGETYLDNKLHLYHEFELIRAGQAQLVFYASTTAGGKSTNIGINDNHKNLVTTLDVYTARLFDHADSTNPTDFLHSATDPNTANDEWISREHDQTNGIIATGKGDIYLNPAGSVRFGTYTGGAATDSTGYITINDAAGNARKLMVQA